MTVRRQKEAIFQTPKTVVVECVRKVLHSNPFYTHVVESIEGSFLTLVQPNFLFLDTPMTILLETIETGTLIKVTTESQPFILGDIFNFYNRYITDFLTVLKEEINNSTQRETPTANPG